MITSAGNVQMKHVAALIKKAKERRAERLFVVEGRKMYEEAPKEWISAVYVSESFLKEAEETGLSLRQPYEVVSDTVFRAISDTKTPQGILCLMRMPHYELEELIDGERTHLLILESIQDPGNLGTIIRTADAFGADGILLSEGCADCYSPKVLRSTMGSVFRLPIWTVPDLAQTLKELHQAGFSTFGAALDETAICLGNFSFPQKSVAVVGNEGNGISRPVLDACQQTLYIPMKGETESLNAGVAASLILWEMCR